MKSAVHQYEDKLLEFAYGELARQEADAVEAHVRGCARCTQALEEIRGVRQTMAQLPMVAAPDAGLDSLLAYAEQAAKRNATEKPAAAAGWRRFLAPLALVMTLVTVGVVGYRAKDEFDTSPATAAADAKLDKLEEARAKAKEEAPPPAPATPVVAAQPQQPADLPMAAGPQPHPTPKADETAAAAGDSDGNLDAKLARQPEGAEAAYDKKGGKTAPLQSVTRRAFNQTGKDVADGKSVQDESALQDGLLQKNNAPPPPPPASPAKFDNNDSMNAGAGLAKEEAKRDATKTLEVTKSPPKPAVAAKSKKPQLAPKDVAEPNEAWAPAPAPMAEQPQEKPSFGLGTGGAQQVPSNRPEPKIVTEGEAESSLRAGKNRQEAEKRAAEEDQRKVLATKEAADKQAQKQQASAPPTVATVQPTAPAPVVAPPPQPQGGLGYDGNSKKSSYTLGPLAGSTSSAPGRGAPVQQQPDDALSVRPSTDRLDNDDANKVATQRAQFTGDAIESARMASNRGDRRGEIQFALKALQTGATGSTRAEALARICEAYEALGESGSGETYCVQLMKEFPTAPAAQRVAERRNQYRVSPAKKAAPKSERERKAADFESLDEKPKPADAAPAQSY